MAQRKVARKATKASGGLTPEERAALRETVRERKGPNDESAVLAAIAKMPPAERAVAKRVHDLVKAAAPGLTPKTWYGMPAYANTEGKVVCFFQDANKFKARYATLGFSDTASLDDGAMWPTSFALTKLTAAEEKRITDLVRRAAR
ncbi:MAG: hypothetical protein FJ028_00295 [Chloroflexi bacterium]|nr:hypothetical protein [Chloroflexota bacterium]